MGQLHALSEIPEEYLSHVDALVRLPPSDEEVVGARKALQFHCGEFDKRQDKQRIIARYKRELPHWQAKGDFANIMKHSVHVSAWVSFASGVDDACTVDLVSLLNEMLRGLGKKYPIPRLNLALRHVADRLQDLIDDGICGDSAASTLQVINRLLGRAPPFGGFATYGHAPGARGGQRTDVQFVRQVLGSRELPPGYRILYKAGRAGRSPRWYAALAGRRSRAYTDNALTGSNASTSRFTEEDAIEHVYRFILHHSANHNNTGR